MSQSSELPKLPAALIELFAGINEQRNSHGEETVVRQRLAGRIRQLADALAEGRAANWDGDVEEGVADIREHANRVARAASWHQVAEKLASAWAVTIGAEGHGAEQVRGGSERLAEKLAGNLNDRPEDDLDASEILAGHHATALLVDLCQDGDSFSDENWATAVGKVQSFFGRDAATAVMRGRFQDRCTAALVTSLFQSHNVQSLDSADRPSRKSSSTGSEGGIDATSIWAD